MNKVGFRSRKYRIFIVTGVMGAAILAALFYSWYNMSHTRLADQAPTKEFINSKNLTITSELNFAPDGDRNKNKKYDPGDIVRVTFDLKHIATSQETDMQLYTGLSKTHFFEVFNPKGFTGYKYISDELVISNVKVSTDIENKISADLRLRLTDKRSKLETYPRLFNQNNELIKAGGRAFIAIEAGESIVNTGAITTEEAR